MSYQKPKQWWCRMLPFLARCQRVDYKRQHELGAMGFDLRIFFDKNGDVEFRHGAFRYPADSLYEVLDYARDNRIIVRILFELRGYNKKKYKNVDELVEKFKDFCSMIEEMYPTVGFYGGVATCAMGEVLYDFKNKPSIKEIGLYSSTTSFFTLRKYWLKVIDDWCPFIYAKLMNRQNIGDHSNDDDSTYVVVDFIDIQ